MRKTRTEKKASPNKASPSRASHPVPGLVGALLQFDLANEADQLRKEGPWNTTSRNAKTLAKYTDLRIVLIVMKSGVRMEGHKADGSISIQGLAGKLKLHLANQTVELPAGRLLTLERGLPHEVEAMEESAFLLTISWPRGA
jgi:quercetin dioxygenase-like cupin family protein